MKNKSLFFSDPRPFRTVVPAVFRITSSHRLPFFFHYIQNRILFQTKIRKFGEFCRKISSAPFHFFKILRK